MSDSTRSRADAPSHSSDRSRDLERPAASACPVCGGKLFEIRAKLQCTRCHTICETCCEGGRG